jgi:hypothetical protein
MHVNKFTHTPAHAYIQHIDSQVSCGLNEKMHPYLVSQTQTYIHASTHIYIYTYTHTYIHTYSTSTLKFPDLIEKLHPYLGFTNTYLHTCMHTHIHTYIHTYMHTCIQHIDSSSLTAQHVTCAIRLSR